MIFHPYLLQNAAKEVPSYCSLCDKKFSNGRNFASHFFTPSHIRVSVCFCSTEYMLVPSIYGLINQDELNVVDINL